MPAPLFFELFFGAAFGAVFGSFFSAAAWSWINGLPFWRRRSVCDKCGAQLSPLELIPIASYLFLGGRCRKCQRAIPIFHFLLELIPTTLGSLFFWRWGMSWLAICYTIIGALVSAA